MKWAFLEYDFPQGVKASLSPIDTRAIYELRLKGVYKHGTGMMGPYGSLFVALSRQDWADDKVIEVARGVRQNITIVDTISSPVVFFMYAFRFGLHAAVAYTRGMDFKVIAEGRALYLSWKAERLIQSFVGLKGE